MRALDDFAAALLPETFDCPSGLRTWNGSDPAQRFGVYRNNVMASLVDALADTYPVSQALVGETFFRAMASQFVRREPPKSPVLTWYGDSFAAFIQGFAPASSVPYLADIARLEMLYVQSYHAADEAPLTAAELAGLLTDASTLPHVCFTLHPSVGVLRSGYAVVSLWAAHQDETPANSLNSIDPSLAESAMLVRSALDVEIFRVEDGTAEFIENLMRGVTFAAAVSTASPFNLNAALELLIRCGAITHYRVME